MSTIRQVRALLYKDLTIEFRNRYVLGGIALYVVSSVLVVYFAMLYSGAASSLSSVYWSIFFWLIVLFSAINAVANSFFRESEGRRYYYYYTSSSQAYIIAKMCYNLIFTLLLILLAFVVYSVVMGLPVGQVRVFILTAILGGVNYALLFTLMGAIASRAGNNASLVAVLGFPIIIPLIIFITRLSAASLAATSITASVWQYAGLLLAFGLIQCALAFILFPYIWRD
jgi:heme exporter protein B